MDRYNVQRKSTLGVAYIPATGARVEVVATQHGAIIPGFEGSDGVCFAVEVTNPMTGAVDRAYGFTSEADCWRFVTSEGRVGFEVPDQRGQPYTDERDCLGIPDGLVRRAVDVETGALVA